MSNFEADIARLHEMADEARRIRNRTCEPKTNANPRYLALSNAVSGMQKAADDMRREL